jgi:hypothetical protein
MRDNILAKFSKHFLFLAIGFLLLSSPFVIKAQNTSAGCERGYVYRYVYDYVYEPVTETQWNGYEYETRTRYKWIWKWVWKCVPSPPAPSETNSTTSRDKKIKSSDSKVVHDAEVKPSLGLRPPYAGQYNGTWITTNSDLGGAQRGEWTLSVGTDGRVTGKEVNTTFNATADINGSLSKNGYIELSLQYGGIFKNSPPALIKGRITNAESRHLKGTLTQYNGDKITSVIEIDLKPLAEQKENREVVESSTVATGRNPKEAEAYYDRAESEFALEDYRGAIADYDQAIRIYSAIEPNGEAILKAEKDRKAKGGTAVSQERLNCELPSWYPIIYHKRGLAKEMLGNKVAACDDFRRSCELGSPLCAESKKHCQ